MAADLHLHTAFSDGTYSPEELVRHAVRQRLQVIALTDHDTVGGVAEAKAEGARQGVTGGTDRGDQLVAGLRRIGNALRETRKARQAFRRRPDRIAGVLVADAGVQAAPGRRPRPATPDRGRRRDTRPRRGVSRSHRDRSRSAACR